MFAPIPTAQKPLLLLIAAPVIFIIAVALGRWLKRGNGVQFGLAYQLFAAVIAIYVPVRILGLQYAQRELGAAAVLLGSFVVMALLQRYLWNHYFAKVRGTDIPAFIRDLSALTVFVIAGAIVLAYFYKQPLTGLLAGSGIAAIVVGIAMQDLLGNILSGIALHIGKPFKPGDWLMFEKEHAEVMEVNWRSTRLRTDDDICLDVPNNLIVKSTIVNLSHPTRVHAVRIKVGVDYEVPPNRVKDMLRKAANASLGVLPAPPVQALLHDFGDSAIIYELEFSTDRDDVYDEVLDSVRTNVWYEFHRNGITIPFPIRTLHIPPRRKASVDDSVSQAAMKCLRTQPLLQFLEQLQLERLVGGARMQLFGSREKLIEQGAIGDSMFILTSGVADVFVERDGENTRVATLHEDDFFGEMSLLTGEPRSATVIARTDCNALEIPKAVMADLLQEQPGLLQQLSEALAKRRLETEGILEATMEKNVRMAKQQEYRDSFLRKISAFFAL